MLTISPKAENQTHNGGEAALQSSSQLTMLSLGEARKLSPVAGDTTPPQRLAAFFPIELAHIALRAPL